MPTLRVCWPSKQDGIFSCTDERIPSWKFLVISPDPRSKENMQALYFLELGIIQQILSLDAPPEKVLGADNFNNVP